MKPLTQYGFVLTALASMAGCVVGPDYHKPEMAVPADWHSTIAFAPAQPGDAQLKGTWWEVFADARLNTLEQQALAHNQTLVVAAEHLNQARLQLRVTSAAQLPTLDLDASDARSKLSANRPLSSKGLPSSSVVQNNPQLGLSASYEADLFGRVHRLVEGSKAAAEQAAADFENARLVLMADLATSYFNLRELDIEIDIVQQNVVLQQKALDFITKRYQLDYATGLDLAQQQALLSANQTQLTLLDNQRAALQNSIATLTGTAAPTFSLAVDSLPMTVPALPLALPSEVLQRRPDVASAERAMAVANAGIGVARSAYYPSLILQANGGWDSSRFANLLSAPSILWSLGASAAEHLFDGGRTDANVGIAESSYKASVASYRQSVLVAMQEVQTGIDGLSLLERAGMQSRAAVQGSQKALQIANVRYTGGLDIYLNVITAQQTLLTNQRLSAQINGQQLVNAVFLVKALGGGWQTMPLTQGSLQ